MAYITMDHPRSDDQDRRPAEVEVAPEPRRLKLGSQLNGLDEILASARTRAQVAGKTS